VNDDYATAEASLQFAQRSSGEECTIPAPHRAFPVDQADGIESVAERELAQRLYRVRPKRNARADVPHFGASFEHLGVDALSAKRDRSRETADAAANDENSQDRLRLNLNLAVVGPVKSDRPLKNDGLSYKGYFL